MASDKAMAKWCHRHSRSVGACQVDGTIDIYVKMDCAVHAGDVKYNPDWDIAPSPMTATSIEFKTVYDSLTEQGFSEAQAIYLVATQITGNPGIAPGLPVEGPT